MTKRAFRRELFERAKIATSRDFTLQLHLILPIYQAPLITYGAAEANVSTSEEVMEYNKIQVSRNKTLWAIRPHQLSSAVRMPNASLIFSTPHPFNAIDGIYIACH